MNFQNDIVDHETQGDNQIFSLNKIKTKKVNIFIFNFILFYSNYFFLLYQSKATPRVTRNITRFDCV